MAFIEPGPRRVPRPQREDCGSFFSTGPWKGKASACLRICSHPTSFQSWQQADLAEVNMTCLISLKVYHPRDRAWGYLLITIHLSRLVLCLTCEILRPETEKSQDLASGIPVQGVWLRRAERERVPSLPGIQCKETGSLLGKDDPEEWGV